METWELILTIIGLVLVLGGVVMVYDARIIAKRLFSFGDQNAATRWMKVIGVIVGVIGSGIIIFT